MYKIINFNFGGYCIKRLKDSSYIPVDKENNDYQEYLQWILEGNEAEEYNPEGI
jgi:hypothetical protein